MPMVQTAFSSKLTLPWWPELTSELAELKWAKLDDLGLTKKNYSTTGVVLGKDYEPKLLIDILCPQNLQSNSSPRVEVLQPVVESVFAKQGLRFCDVDRSTQSHSGEVLDAAFRLIGAVPSLLSSVTSLGKSIVLLEPKDDASDVSYSSPDVPFSIFISLPRSLVLNCHARVAEAIIHECMHLQLTLLEEWRPLIDNCTETHFSPWKNEFRNTSGILHGLYVFTVIKAWLEKSQIADSAYVEKRIKQIVYDVKRIRNFSASSDLTLLGRSICDCLFDQLLFDAAI